MSICKTKKCIEAVIRTINGDIEKIDCLVYPIEPGEVVTECNCFEDEESLLRSVTKPEKPSKPESTKDKKDKTVKKPKKQGEKDNDKN